MRQRSQDSSQLSQDSKGQILPTGVRVKLQATPEEPKVKVKVAQSCLTLCNPTDYIQSMEFSRPEYWSG